MSADTEKEFTHEGIEYVAVDTDTHASCTGCAFIDENCGILRLPSCWAQTRADGKYKIWVVK